MATADDRSQVASRPVRKASRPGAGHPGRGAYGRPDVAGRHHPRDGPRMRHAAHSRWHAPPAQTTAWVEVAHMLEESRIEAAQVTRRPGDRRWLRGHRYPPDPGRLHGRRRCHGHRPGGRLGRGLGLGPRRAGILDPGETAPCGCHRGRGARRGPAQAVQRYLARRARTADDDVRVVVRLGRRWCCILGIYRTPRLSPPPASHLHLPSPARSAGAPKPSRQPWPTTSRRRLRSRPAGQLNCLRKTPPAPERTAPPPRCSIATLPASRQSSPAPASPARRTTSKRRRGAVR
jgi:hypothetical protein